MHVTFLDPTRYTSQTNNSTGTMHTHSTSPHLLGHSGDGCVLASTLCKYNLRKDDLFVLSWAMVRRVRRGSISSELLMCGGGVRSILLLSLVA